MQNYVSILAVLGIVLLGMAWMPGLTKKIRISYSIIYVVFGMLLYTFLDVLPLSDPFRYQHFTIRLTELMVIVSLMGTGLKIDERFTVKGWIIPLKLVSITMLLSIALVTWLGISFLGLELPSALLLGAVLAPTDPVLADDVQVGPPLEKSKNDVRFSLTAEAGLNDGMAFPFTWLAITLALIPLNESTLSHWFTYDFLYRLIIGAGVGYLIGRLVAYLVFYLPNKHNFLVTRDGFVALSLTLLAYGTTELIHGYGFVAVFICAVTLRNVELEHEYHVKLHSFTDQVERMLMSIVLVLFGGTLVGGILQTLTWEIIVFAVIMVFAIRPLTAYIAVFNSTLHFKEKAAISFYGIKGIGSFFYLAFALNQTSFHEEEKLWSVVSVVVLGSILVHGFSASLVMGKIEKQFPQERVKEKPTNDEQWD